MTPALVDRVKDKIERQPWARQIWTELQAEADTWLARPIDPPTTGGGWYHNYVCPKDAGFLTYDADSPHRHWCPRCKAYYEGEKLDANWVNQRHMEHALAAEHCGLAWQITGRPEYAAWTARLLRWYADRYESFPVHGQWAGRGKVTGQSLDEAMWLVRMTNAFDLVSAELSDADRRAIIDKLLLPAARHIETFAFGVHNIECWHAASRLMVGITADDAALRDRAIESLRKNIAEGITSDGFWFEGSIGYHQFTMMALTPALLVARHNDIDLGPPEKLLGMYNVLAKLALPGGELPGLNDGSPGGNLGSMGYFLESGCYLFDENPELVRQLGMLYTKGLRERAGGKLTSELPALLYGPAVFPTIDTLDLESYALPGIGLAVLRQGGNTAILKAGSICGGHDHADRGNLIFADAHRTWFADLGTPGYGHPLHVPWYKHTASHCTVLVDGRPQKISVPGRIVQFDDGPAYKLATVGCDRAYEGVMLMRTVVLVDGIVLDRFQVRSKAEHAYTFMLHGPGSVTLQPPAISAPADTPSLDFKPIELQAAAAAQPSVSAQWHTEASDYLYASLHATRPVGVYTGMVPGYPGEADVTALALTTRGNTVTFAAAYAPSHAGPIQRPPEVIAIENTRVEYRGATIDGQARRYTIEWTGDQARLISRDTP